MEVSEGDEDENDDDDENCKAKKVMKKSFDFAFDNQKYKSLINSCFVAPKCQTALKIRIHFSLYIADDSVPPTIERLTSSQMLPWGAPKERTR